MGYLLIPPAGWGLGVCSNQNNQDIHLVCLTIVLKSVEKPLHGNNLWNPSAILDIQMPSGVLVDAHSIDWEEVKTWAADEISACRQHVRFINQNDWLALPSPVNHSFSRPETVDRTQDHSVFWSCPTEKSRVVGGRQCRPSHPTPDRHDKHSCSRELVSNNFFQPDESWPLALCQPCERFCECRRVMLKHNQSL